jgi:hypothetical protein
MIEIKDDTGAVLHRLDAPTLAGASLANCYLRKAQLAEADLRGANLRDADLREANLRGADLRDAKIDDANFDDAVLEAANLEGMKVSSLKTSFARTKLATANMSGADMAIGSWEGADLRGANLTGVWFRSPTMNGAQLSRATLHDALITSGDMTGLNLIEADLSGVRYIYSPHFRDVLFDRTTIWPRDFALLRNAIGRLNLLSATIVACGLCVFVGQIYRHPWIGGCLGVLAAYFGLPFLLWRRNRFVARNRDWEIVRIAAMLTLIFAVIQWGGCGSGSATSPLADFAGAWHGNKESCRTTFRSRFKARSRVESRSSAPT